MVYPTEGTPLVVGPNGIFKDAPNPERRAAVPELLLHAECQQLIIDVGGAALVHPQTKEKAGPQAVPARSRR